MCSSDLFRNNDEYVIKNNSELVFNVECEDYGDDFTGDGVPTGRIYANNIYVIKEFLLKIDNAAQGSPLGLLSGRDYFVNSDYNNINAPQSFWVDDQDNLLFSTETGETRTQLDNQFVWISNYLSVDENNVVKLSENIGSTFEENTITGVLGSNEFNVGVGTDLLEFSGSNNSLFEMDKWTDLTTTVESTQKLLTTVHPVISSLDRLVENNSDKVRVLDPGDENAIIIPLNIYFKFNSIDPNSGSGKDFDYVDFNNSVRSKLHSKFVKFFLENEADNRPFQFTIKFNMKRNKLVVPKSRSLTLNKFRR